MVALPVSLPVSEMGGAWVGAVVLEAEMRMEVVNRKRSMSLPDGCWHECEDKRGA